MSPQTPLSDVPPPPTPIPIDCEEIRPRRRSHLRRPAPWTVMTMLLCAAALPAILGASPAMAAAPHAGADLTPNTSNAAPANVDTWAWGVAANLTAALQYEGEYSGTQALTGSNLTQTGAYIDLDISMDLAYAAYAIVNESAPGETGGFEVTVVAAQAAAATINAVASGTFPAAGTYASTSPVTLEPMNVSLGAHLRVAQTFTAFLNFTQGANSSVALANEHLHLVETASLGLAAVNFPNVTATPSGGFTVSYTTGTLSATAQAEADLLGTFAPAVPLLEGPLSVGKSWVSSSTATFVGSSSWGIQAQGVLANGEGGSWNDAGSSSLNATEPVDLLFTVTGVHTIYFAGGGNETDYVITNSPVFGEPNGVSLEDGLFLLPANDGTQAVDNAFDVVAPEHPASDAVATDDNPHSSAMVASDHELPNSEEATPVQGQTVEASPMSPHDAQSVMNGIPAPSAPSATPSTATVLVEAAIGFTVIAIVVLAVVIAVDRSQRQKQR